MARRSALLLVAALAVAGPDKEPGDIENPRAPGTPLEIVFTPFWCNVCTPETPGFEAPKEPVTLLRVEPEKLAGMLDMGKGWILI